MNTEKTTIKERLFCAAIGFLLGGIAGHVMWLVLSLVQGEIFNTSLRVVVGFAFAIAGFFLADTMVDFFDAVTDGFGKFLKRLRTK